MKRKKKYTENFSVDAICHIFFWKYFINAKRENKLKYEMWFRENCNTLHWELCTWLISLRKILNFNLIFLYMWKKCTYSNSFCYIFQDAYKYCCMHILFCFHTFSWIFSKSCKLQYNNISSWFAAFMNISQRNLCK